MAGPVRHERISVNSADRQKLPSILKSRMWDESGYEEKAWPVIKAALEENRLSSRKRLSE